MGYGVWVHLVNALVNPMDDLIAAILRGESARWPAAAGREEQMCFLRAATGHGVLPLLAHQLHRAKTLDQWPEPLRERFVHAARQEVLLESLRRSELERVLRSLAAANVHSLLMKGTALAYLQYEHRLRPRGDTDLLVRQSDVTAATRVMHALGYRRSVQTPGELVMPQMEFVKEAGSSVKHVYDLHSKIANPQLFADVLSFDELCSRSVEIPELGNDARALGPVDSLLLACLHRVAHHHDSARLLWIYDIHLVASEMDREAFARFGASAAQKELKAVCARGLTLAEQWFRTAVPADVMEALAVRDEAEPSEAYLGGQLRQVDVLWSDLKTLGRWRDRWQLVRQHLFPPGAYMRERYGLSNPLLLPALYAHRGVRGACAWFRRPSAREA